MSDWDSLNIKVSRRQRGEQEVHVAFTIEITKDMTEEDVMRAAVAAMRKAARLTNEATAIDSDEPE